MGRLSKVGIDARKEFDSFCHQVVAAHVRHNPGDPAPAEFKDSILWKALDNIMRRSAAEYVKRVFTLLPKQVDFQHTNIHELPDDWLMRLIEDRRDALKLIEHDVREVRQIAAQ